MKHKLQENITICQTHPLLTSPTLVPKKNSKVRDPRTETSHNLEKKA